MNNEDDLGIGRWVRQAREKTGLSLSELADRIGHQRGSRGGSSYLTRLENGAIPSPRVDLIQRIVDATGVEFSLKPRRR